MISNQSTHPAFSHLDGVAGGMSDLLLLVGRVLVASVFVLTATTFSPNAAYLTGLHYPAPEFWSVIAIVVEWVIGATLVFGLATRYGAALALAYVVVAVATAHRYWEFPQAQQGVQYIFFTKDLSILGGLVVLFVTGGGRYSIDTMLAGKR
jgi:putative oxidoreductase